MAKSSKEMEMAYAGVPYYPAGLARSRPRPHRFYERSKRMLDISLSLLGLLVLSPLMLVVALLIKIDDPRGGVLFRQVRVGKWGQSFTMLKFRSMTADAEGRLEQLLQHNEIQGKMFKMKNDPRITRIGRILRKTSLDELPQLWNVLAGDMSLVGPRPSLPREVELYTPAERERLHVIPGCTGLWQVSGRSRLSFEQMVELDLFYIRHRNLRMDIGLILRTFKVMILKSDAY
ncbi:sugar transferase [Cohnella sp. JJ-181]|uniref:sugar transferase n=1 Tax=Cohnella rhizoplanae TaxID=2974897 RepID=UPI0022FF5138|nr:sugar transferase [Cohnella sp. JJ-181]CAI6036663.1 putative sugar transferase EpsL [Cohnella sp. JJ-181]